MNKAENKDAIAKAIINQMEAKGITRRQLAERMGKSPSEVTRWLSGKHNFTVDTLCEISEVIDSEEPSPLHKYVSGYASSLEAEVLKDSWQNSAVLSIRIERSSINGLKRMADSAGIGLDTLAGRILKNALRASSRPLEFPKVTLPDRLPDDLMELCGCVSFTEEQIEQDDKLAYILSR